MYKLLRSRGVALVFHAFSEPRIVFKVIFLERVLAVDALPLFTGSFRCVPQVAHRHTLVSRLAGEVLRGERVYLRINRCVGDCKYPVIFYSLFVYIFVLVVDRLENLDSLSCIRILVNVDAHNFTR